MGSQSFNWQVKEEGLIKKTESEGLPCMPEKNSERVGVTKGQFQLRKMLQSVRHDRAERCPVNVAARIIDPGKDDFSIPVGEGKPS